MEQFNKKIEMIMNGEKHLSFSSFKHFFKSPKHFYISQTEEQETTDAMRDGTAFHMCILEPKKFDSEYWVLDDSEKIKEIGGGNPRGTKAYKEWKAIKEYENNGKEQIKKELRDNLIHIREYLQRNTATKDLLSGLIEKEYQIDYEFEGLRFTGRIDGVGSNYLIDLKKVADADFNKLRWKIRDDYLHVQAAMYAHSTNIKNYYLIFVDLKGNVTVVKLSPEVLHDGWSIFVNSVDNFKSCAEEDKFYCSYEFYNNGYVLV